MYRVPDGVGSTSIRKSVYKKAQRKQMLLTEDSDNLGQKIGEKGQKSGQTGPGMGQIGRKGGQKGGSADTDGGDVMVQHSMGTGGHMVTVGDAESSSDEEEVVERGVAVVLHNPLSCYICRKPFVTLHHFYAQVSMRLCIYKCVCVHSLHYTILVPHHTTPHQPYHIHPNYLQ